MDREVPAKLDGECYEALRSVMADSTLLVPRHEETYVDRWTVPNFEVTEAYI